METKLVAVEVVKSSTGYGYDLKMTYADGRWHYFSKGFGTKEKAEAVRRELLGG